MYVLIDIVLIVSIYNIFLFQCKVLLFSDLKCAGYYLHLHVEHLADTSVQSTFVRRKFNSKSLSVE